jgi:hypothetical protein
MTLLKDDPIAVTALGMGGNPIVTVHVSRYDFATREEIDASGRVADELSGLEEVAIKKIEEQLNRPYNPSRYQYFKHWDLEGRMLRYEVAIPGAGWSDKDFDLLLKVRGLHFRVFDERFYLYDDDKGGFGVVEAAHPNKVALGTKLENGLYVFSDLAGSLTRSHRNRFVAAAQVIANIL